MRKLWNPKYNDLHSFILSISPLYILKRRMYRMYVKNLVFRYKELCIDPLKNNDNVSINELRFLKAKIMYWQERFSPYGKYFIERPYGISYPAMHLWQTKNTYISESRYSKEMEWMGFTRRIREIEKEVLKNEKHPWTINYFPEKHKETHPNISVPLDYRESLHPETKTFENYIE